MTTAMGGEQRPLGRFGQFARKLAHYDSWIMGAMVASYISVQLWKGWGGSIPSLTVSFVTITLLLLSLYGETLHIRHWDCPTYVERAPENPAAEVERHRPRLKLRHNPRFALFGLVGLALYMIAPIYIPSPWVLIVTAPFLVYVVVMTLVNETHRNLQAWCPWCHPGGWEGHPEIVPDPAPSGVKVKT